MVGIIFGIVVCIQMVHAAIGLCYKRKWKRECCTTVVASSSEKGKTATSTQTEHHQVERRVGSVRGERYVTKNKTREVTITTYRATYTYTHPSTDNIYDISISRCGGKGGPFRSEANVLI